jgi:hypothetical protein
MAPGARRLFERAHRNCSEDPWWRDVMRSSEGLGCVPGDGSDGKGFSWSAPTIAAHNTSFTRRGLWPLATAGGEIGLE